MKFPFNLLGKEKEVPLAIGPVIEAKGSSSQASSKAGSGSHLSAFDTRIPPRIPFKDRQNFYLSIGRVQNVTESMVLDIINREWYYDTGNEEGGQANENAVKAMEDWEEQHNISGLLSKMVRNWIICGVHIISPKDWKPVQLQTITGKSRNADGDTLFYIQTIHGRDTKLDATKFLEVPYIELDREAWPVGMFDALMNTEWLDIDGRDPVPALSLYRQALQDNMKIHHKYASPRVIYTVPNASREQIDNEVTPMVEGMHPGDRIVLNKEVMIMQETVDGNARFIEHVNKIIEEVESGLGSSKNRLITQPSAMADAKEAGSQDDDRIMGIMERIRIFMNREVIPRVTGLMAGEVVFKWGSKDSFNLEFPEAIKTAIDARVIRPEQALVMLMENFRWKVPSIEEAAKELGIDVPEEDPLQASQPPSGGPPQDPKEDPNKEDPPKAESQPVVHMEQSNEEKELDRKLKNEKIVFIDTLTRKVNEV